MGGTCLHVGVHEVLLGARHRLQHHLEVLPVVGEGALLEDVASLVEHLLQVGEQFVQLLACARHKVTESGET